MPDPIDVTNYAGYNGAANAQGIASLQRGLTAADAGTKFMGFDPASIIFTTLAKWMMNRGGRDGPPAIEQTPEGLVDSLYNYLQSTEGQLQAGDTEGRDAQYQALLDQATKLGMTNITGEVAQNPYATGFAANPVVAAQSAADTLLSQIKDFFPFYDQSQLVLNPVTGTGNIVFGTPPAGQPVIQAGQLPRSNTNVGVTTGIPVLDQAINSVLSKPGGLDSGSIRDSVIDIISKQSGLDPATTATILGKDLETILATANADVANTAARVGINLMPEEKDDVVKDDPYSIVTDGQSGTADPTGPGPQLPTKVPSVDTGVIRSPQVYPEVDTIKTLEELGLPTLPTKVPSVDTGVIRGPQVYPEGDMRKTDPYSIIKTDFPPVGPSTVTLTPADLGEDTPVVVNPPIVVGPPPPLPPKITVTPPPVTPTSSQGMRMESTEKAGLADINSTFDLDSTFIENLMRALSGKDDTGSEVSYYSGGKVAPYADIDEIIRLLRG
jgi:hypothetical protein